MLRLLPIAALVCAVPAAAVTIDWVYVGDPGNPPDAASNCIDHAADCGSVPYDYYISKYEITNAQYAEFLNAVADNDTYGLYDTQMGSDPNGGITRAGSSGSYTYSVKPGGVNKPVWFVKWWNAARFANWLHNGQPTGAQGPETTEDGAYTITAEGLESNTTTRNAGVATVFIPTENEWYKAAYYDPIYGAYFDYPMSSNIAPSSDMPPGGPNSGNFRGSDGSYAVTGSSDFDPDLNYLTDVGAYTGSPSPYGTFDQGGNLYEWNETASGPYRGYRGGTWIFFANRTAAFDPSVNVLFNRSGFRVAGLAGRCDDGVDNDGDGLSDLADPGCANPSDLDEHSPTLPCDDGVDNDSDGTADYLLAGGGDPACAFLTSPREQTACQDGINNDYSPGIDFDGGASLNGGVPIAAADPQCVGMPWRSSEAVGPACGLGFEVVLALLPLGLAARRGRESSHRSLRSY